MDGGSAKAAESATASAGMPTKQPSSPSVSKVGRAAAARSFASVSVCSMESITPASAMRTTPGPIDTNTVGHWYPTSDVPTAHTGNSVMSTSVTVLSDVHFTSGPDTTQCEH